MSSTLLLGKLALITGDLQLKSKVIVVYYLFFTGAGSGIGRAAAIRFAQEGSTVICADRNLEAAAATAKKLGCK